MGGDSRPGWQGQDAAGELGRIQQTREEARVQRNSVNERISGFSTETAVSIEQGTVSAPGTYCILIGRCSTPHLGGGHVSHGSPWTGHRPESRVPMPRCLYASMPLCLYASSFEASTCKSNPSIRQPGASPTLRRQTVQTFGANLGHIPT